MPGVLYTGRSLFVCEGWKFSDKGLSAFIIFITNGRITVNLIGVIYMGPI